MEIIENIIPIVIIASIIIYPYNASHFANSVLGKIFSILLIIFYSSSNIVYGVIVCILIVIYYRSIEYQEGFKDAKELFREQNCKNGELKYKSLPVKPEMASHVFPELEFERKPCNPCAETCDFSIVEEKMANEEVLIAPKNSNDWFHDAWSKITNIPSNPSPSESSATSFSTIMV
jgi:hypothetical protein